MKWLGTHIIWVLGLIQMILGVWASATDVFSPWAVKIILLASGTITVVVGYLKLNPPDPVQIAAKLHWATVVALMATMLLMGCTALGLSSPKGFDQSLAEAYGVHTAVVNATAESLKNGSISVSDATAIQGLEKNARALLDTAKSAELAGNTAGAQKNLVLATTALTALQGYLQAKGK